MTYAITSPSPIAETFRAGRIHAVSPSTVPSGATQRSHHDCTYSR